MTFGSVFPNSFFAKAGQGWNQNLGGAEIGSFGRGLAYGFRPHWWTVVLWTIAYTGAYIVLGVLQFGWYYPPLVPALALLTAYGIDTLGNQVQQRVQYGRTMSAVLTVLFSVACLIPNADWLLKSRRFEIDAHSATYVQVGHWLRANTRASDSVGLLEIGIIGYYSDRTVIDTMGLVSPAMIGHLEDWLQTLQFAVNRFWPDYVVALKHTAWDIVVKEPWFKAAYEH